MREGLAPGPHDRARGLGRRGVRPARLDRVDRAVRARPARQGGRLPERRHRRGQEFGAGAACRRSTSCSCDVTKTVPEPGRRDRCTTSGAATTRRRRSTAGQRLGLHRVPRPRRRAVAGGGLHEPQRRVPLGLRRHLPDSSTSSTRATRARGRRGEARRHRAAPGQRRRLSAALLGLRDRGRRLRRRAREDRAATRAPRRSTWRRCAQAAQAWGAASSGARGARGRSCWRRLASPQRAARSRGSTRRSCARSVAHHAGGLPGPAVVPPPDLRAGDQHRLRHAVAAGHARRGRAGRRRDGHALPRPAHRLAAAAAADARRAAARTLARIARVRRAAVMWLVLFAAYAAGVGLHASPGEDLSAPEAHVLLFTRSIVDDGDLDLSDEYGAAAWRPFYGGDARAAHGAARARAARADRGRLPAADRARLRARRPRGGRAVAGGAGRPGLRRRRRDRAAPRARAVGHARGARRRAVAARGHRRHHDRARRGGRQRAGGRGRAGARRPRAPAGAAHGLGAACSSRRCRGWACASWRPALVVLVGVFRWPRRRQRGLAGLVGVEVALFSAVLFVSIDDRLYGGLTPYAVLPAGESPTGAHGLAAHLERWPRLVWLWIGPPEGLLLWAPVCALALVAVWLLVRSRRERLARVLGEQADVEVTAGFLLAVFGAAVLVVGLPRPHHRRPVVRRPPARRGPAAARRARAAGACGASRAPAACWRR